MFLPTNKAEMRARGWQALDIIIVTGDAYIDHPSFGAALIGRHLEAQGYRVGIIAQPAWQNDKDFLALGQPKLFFGVTAGNLDSIVNHYTAQRKLRQTDAFSPDGQIGKRPNLPSIVYTQKIKKLFKNCPVVLGGVEASLRRLPHYDYYSDKIRNSILFDSKADILVYGMGEKPILQIAHALASEQDIAEIKAIPGTVVTAKSPEEGYLLPEYSPDFSLEDFYHMSLRFEENFRSQILYQKFGQRYLKHNPPALALNCAEMDNLYALPFARAPHPRYNDQKLTAFEQIKNSVTSHRGCFGGCAFCSIGYHQGKTISSRSQDSISSEIKTISNTAGFHGTISDVGGPSANMYQMYCKLGISATCLRRSCLYPQICPHLQHSHQPILDLLQKCRQIDGVKNLFIGSGVRFDLALDEEKYIQQLAKNYTSGLLKLAPEHKNSRTLQIMHKPDFSQYQNFSVKYAAASKKAGKNQTIVPYMIVGHPGSDLKAALELAIYLKKNNIHLQQIQEFTPTPMSESTLAYLTGKTLDGQKVYVPRGREIRLQKALVQWYEPKNRKLIIEALKKAGRLDLRDFFLGPNSAQQNKRNQADSSLQQRKSSAKSSISRRQKKQ
ncbi:MAG: YgiQ family radical SAM protein [Candidatus Cloacimonadales bacterium]